MSNPYLPSPFNCSYVYNIISMFRAEIRYDNY